MLGDLAGLLTWSMEQPAWGSVRSHIFQRFPTYPSLLVSVWFTVYSEYISILGTACSGILRIRYICETAHKIKIRLDRINIYFLFLWAAERVSCWYRKFPTPNVRSNRGFVGPKAGSQECCGDSLCRCQEPNYKSHHCCVPLGLNWQEVEARTRSQESNPAISIWKIDC